MTPEFENAVRHFKGIMHHYVETIGEKQVSIHPAILVCFGPLISRIEQVTLGGAPETKELIDDLNEVT